MEIKFKRAKWTLDGDGTWICLLSDNPQAAKVSVSKIEENKQYVCEIKQFRKKRSLDANAYAWALINQLAVKLRLTPEEVYRSHIKDVADNYEQLLLSDDSIESFCKIWSKNGIGWVTEFLAECRTQPGYSWIRAYYGSSEFDTAQMARFIDFIIDDCKEQGIETIPPQELEALLNQWQAKEQKN